jgi:hypothetical protein
MLSGFDASAAIERRNPSQWKGLPLFAQWFLELLR